MKEHLKALGVTALFFIGAAVLACAVLAMFGQFEAALRFGLGVLALVIAAGILIAGTLLFPRIFKKKA